MRLALFTLLISIFSVTQAADFFPASEDEKVGSGFEELEKGWKLYINNGDMASAQAIFLENAKKHPNSAIAAFAISQMYMQQDKNEEALAWQIKGLAQKKWTPWMEMLLGDAISIQQYVKDISPLKKILEKRENDPQVTWIERSLIRGALMQLVKSPEEYNAINKKEPFVRDWMVLGPFANRDKSGFAEKDKISGLPVTKFDSDMKAIHSTKMIVNKAEMKLLPIDFKKTHKGRGGDINWFAVKAPADGELNLSALTYPGKEVYYYAVAYIESKEEGGGCFAVSTSGASKVYVNNYVLYDENSYHSFRKTQRLGYWSLHKGVNRIVFKVAADDKVQAKLSLRVMQTDFTFENEVSAKKVDSNASKLRVLKANEFPIKVIEQPIFNHAGDGRFYPNRSIQWGAMKFFDEYVKKNPENGFALNNSGYFKMKYGLDDDKHHRSRELLEKASKTFPKCPLFLQLASVVQQDENSARDMLEKAAKISADDIGAQMGIAYKLYGGGYYRETEKLLNALPSYHPTAKIMQGDIDLKRNWGAEAALKFRTVTQKSPRWYRGWQKLIATTDSREKAFEMNKIALEKTGKNVFRQNIAGKLFSRNKYDEAAKLYAQMLKRYTYNTWYADRLAACKRAGNDIAGVVKVYDEALTRMPKLPGLTEKRARALLLLGKKKEALAGFETALALKADNPKLKEYLRQLKPKEKTFYADYDISYDELGGKDTKAADYPLYSQVVLLDQGYVKANPNGTRSQMIHMVVKVLRRSGIRQAASHYIPFDPSRQRVEIIRARVIQPDGTIHEKPSIRNRRYGGGGGQGAMYSSYTTKMVMMPQVKEGSIIDFQYVVEDTAANLYLDEFEDRFNVGGMTPTLRFDFAAEVSEKMPIRFHQAGTEIKAVVTKLANGRKLIRWQAKNVAGVEVEPAMPPFGELVAPLKLTTFKDWNDVGNWYWNLSKEQMEIPKDIAEKAHELVKDAKTREEKIAAIYYFIINEIRYVSISFGRYGCKPHKAERTFRAKLGDCKDTAVLFCSLLKVVGVDARIALVRTNNLGIERTGLPASRGFNHAIAYVPPEKKGGKHYWLDGTTDYFAFGEIPAMDRGGFALITGPDGGKVMTIDKDDETMHVTNTKTNVTFKADGAGTLVLKEDTKGAFAPNFRRMFETAGKIKKNIERTMQAKYPGSKLTSFTNSGAENKVKNPWLQIDITAPKLAQKENGSLKYNPWPFPPSMSRRYPVRQTERKHDMMVGYPWTRSGEVVFEVPAGSAFENTPKDIKIEHSFASFVRVVKKEKNKLTITTSLKLKTRRISKYDYAAFKKFCSEVDSAFEEWVTYK